MLGGYDISRDAFFDSIGAAGFVAGKLNWSATPVEPSHFEAFVIWSDNQRSALTMRIFDVVPGENGAIAVLQVTGKRAKVPQDANDALPASGLYHVVSILGLNMALFARGLFWLIRALFALSQRIMLYRGAKELASMPSMLPAADYTFFSGAEMATVYSLIMTAIVPIGMAPSRSAITRRNVTLAASSVLLTTPEQLLGPRFEMSFAAAAMLIACAKISSGKRKAKFAKAWERVLISAITIVLDMVLTTLVASLATAPFLALHFHRVTLHPSHRTWWRWGSSRS